MRGPGAGASRSSSTLVMATGSSVPPVVQETVVPKLLDTPASQHVCRTVTTCRKSGSAPPRRVSGNRSIFDAHEAQAASGLPCRSGHLEDLGTTSLHVQAIGPSGFKPNRSNRSASSPRPCLVSSPASSLSSYQQPGHQCAKALQVLEGEGLLVRIPGLGYHVAQRVSAN